MDSRGELSSGGIVSAVMDDRVPGVCDSLVSAVDDDAIGELLLCSRREGNALAAYRVRIAQDSINSALPIKTRCGIRRRILM